MPTSTDGTEDPKAFYGYLFQHDKAPTELMNELLTGIANYIITHIGDSTVKELTPPKLAEFYKSVGGNYDPVFLQLPHDRISFIYSSVGCQHTLQPVPDDYSPPSIPALTLRGFIRWQSIETLLDPSDHVPYLQFCLRNFPILRADGKTRFPAELPEECLPREPDKAIVKWHEECGNRLWKEYVTPQPTPRGSPRPRSHTGPPAGTPVDNFQYKYAYAHVKIPPGHSFSAASSPRQRPMKEREDYFNSKPVPSARRSKPMTAESSRARQDGAAPRRASPEEYEDIWDRGRRRSVPKNYYNNNPSGLDGADLPTPGRATSHPASPREARPHSGSFGAGTSAKDYVRRHSHPRHKHHHAEDSSSDTEDGDADDSAAGPPSPQYSKMRNAGKRDDGGTATGMGMGGSAHRLSKESMKGSTSKTNIPDLRYEAASPIGTPSRGDGQTYSPRISGFRSMASSFGDAHSRAYSGSGLNVPSTKQRIYKVHSADEEEKLRKRGELRHRNSTSTSGGSRNGSRERERRSKGVQWVKELARDALPFGGHGLRGERRLSGSPPARERDEGQKFRREDVGAGSGVGRREREGEEYKKTRRREAASEEARRVREWERERERDGGRAERRRGDNRGLY